MLSGRITAGLYGRAFNIMSLDWDKKTFQLNSGLDIPDIGFGTYRINEEGKARQIVGDAIACGYRFFDTASFYGTEASLGQSLKESGLDRKEFVLESKLWHDERGFDEARRALEQSLKRLGTDYLDLYLIHWPKGPADQDDETWKKLDRETWRALEEMQEEGLVRSIGCSNFLVHHLKNILAVCNVPPAVDQLELHPGHMQDYTLAFLEKEGIQPMAWGPLGRGKERSELTNNVLKSLAEKYGKSIQQICVRYQLQRGILPIPKASSKEHMLNNADVYGFRLSEEDVDILSCIPQSDWLGEHPDFAVPNRFSREITQ